LHIFDNNFTFKHKNLNMKKNMGIADRIIRTIIAVVIVVLYITSIISGTLGIILLIFSCILLLTSIIGFCPLYLPFGICTCCCCKKKEE